MKFTKMHGAGNDYVYIDCFKEQVNDPEKLSIEVSDRHKGIGSDGLVLIMPSDKADFRMRMFNSDGSEAQMCGNASRCVGKYVYDTLLTDKTEISLETKAGIKYLQLFPENGKVQKVRVNMGEPILKSVEIPVKSDLEMVVDQPVDFEPELYHITCVSMGNPHAIIFTNDVDSLELEKTGKKIEHFRLFPERTNVEFVEIISSDHVKVRVWERGAGETQACGTGACAVLVAGVLNGVMERTSVISLPGGDLQIEWDVKDNCIYMTGEAVTVFNGEFSTNF
ncbi:MAG: diaminopimelate epimerase [Dysgonamonadaceae bacterium]|jgi:diaminopimelate epimerase|nr:diaminopimelate epimerase [Dysgonamonadaceae bacterium]